MFDDDDDDDDDNYYYYNNTSLFTYLFAWKLSMLNYKLESRQNTTQKATKSWKQQGQD